MSREHHSLLLVLPSLGYGGMELQLLTLARAFSARGGRVAFLAGSGPLESVAIEIGDLERVDWQRTRRVETARRARSLIGPETAAVLQADPSTVHLLGSLACMGRVHICLHNRPGTFEEWLHPAVLERLRALVPPLARSRRVGFTASSTEFASAHARAFGLAPGTIKAWLPGVDYPPEQDQLSVGAVRNVGVICRLSKEKLPVVEAAATLVAAGRAAGDDVRLEVHGAGPAEDAARDAVDRHLDPRHCRFHGPTDRPLSVIQELDVVVNAGRTAIEGLVLGRRVATFVADRGAWSPLGGVVSPEGFDTLRDSNFLWSVDEPTTPDDVWRTLRQMDVESVRAVRDRARRELSATAVLEGHLAALAHTHVGTAPPPELVEAVLDQAAVLDDERHAAQALADSLWAERNAPDGKKGP